MSEASGKPTGQSSEAERAQAGIRAHLFWADGLKHLTGPLRLIPGPCRAMWPNLPCMTVGQLKDMTQGEPIACAMYLIHAPDGARPSSEPSKPMIPWTGTVSRELGHMTLPHPAPMEPSGSMCPEGSRPWL